MLSLAGRVYQRMQRGSTRGKGIALPQPRKQADTLVLYIFSNTDAEYENNMRFFLRHGVRADDGCDYVIVIQTGGTSKVAPQPPGTSSGNDLSSMHGLLSLSMRLSQT